MSPSLLVRRAAIAAAVLLAACADAPTAARTDAGPALMPGESARRALLVGAAGDTTTYRFTYSPEAATRQRMGAHEIALPAGAVCDPATSSYGPGTWDSPCTPLASSITFTVRTWADASGRPRVRFSPDVRFVPTTTVMLYLHDKEAALDRRFQTFWCPTGSPTCVNEALRDPSVATQRDPGTFFLYGRIKHFSGYNVIVDRSGEEPIDDGSGFGTE